MSKPFEQGSYSRQASRIEQAMERGDKLHIQLLDRMEIVYGSQSVDSALNKTKKGRSLVSFLILRKGAPVSFEELYEALWDRSEVQNLDNVLKVLVSRTRAILASIDPALRDCIIAQKGAYQWNMDLTAEVDVFAVEAICADLQRTEQMTDVFQKKLETLLCLYAGKLLPDEGAVSWVETYADKLEQQYKQTIDHALMLLQAKSDWNSIVRVCRMALLMLPMEQNWREELMKALLVLNRQDEAMAQYEHVTNMHRMKLEEQSSAESLKAYADMKQIDESLDQDIEKLRDELLECKEIDGAQVCDYSIFKHVYRLQLRIADRYGLVFCLVFFKVTGAVEEMALEPLALEDVMMTLRDVLKQSLRKGDTIARYSPSQYVVLLQNPAAGSIKGILERVRMSFYRNTESVNTQLDHRYRLLLADKGEEKAGEEII